MARSAEKTDTAAGGAVDFEDGDSFSFNMKETAEDAGFAPLPKGTYVVTIASCEYKLSQSSGNPMWSLVYDVSEGEFAEKNRKIFDIVSLKPGQEGRVKKFIARVAPELAELEDFRPKKVADEGLLVGRQLKVKVDIESSEQYGDRNRVKDYFAPGGGGSTSGGGFSM